MIFWMVQKARSWDRFGWGVHERFPIKMSHLRNCKRFKKKFWNLYPRCRQMHANFIKLTSRDSKVCSTAFAAFQSIFCIVHFLLHLIGNSWWKQVDKHSRPTELKDATRCIEACWDQVWSNLFVHGIAQLLLTLESVHPTSRPTHRFNKS